MPVSPRSPNDNPVSVKVNPKMERRKQQIGQAYLQKQGRNDDQSRTMEEQPGADAFTDGPEQQNYQTLLNEHQQIKNEL